MNSKNKKYGIVLVFFILISITFLFLYYKKISVLVYFGILSAGIIFLRLILSDELLYKKIFLWSILISYSLMLLFVFKYQNIINSSILDNWIENRLQPFIALFSVIIIGAGLSIVLDILLSFYSIGNMNKIKTIFVIILCIIIFLIINPAPVYPLIHEYDESVEVALNITYNFNNAIVYDSSPTPWKRYVLTPDVEIRSYDELLSLNAPSFKSNRTIFIFLEKKPQRNYWTTSYQNSVQSGFYIYVNYMKNITKWVEDYKRDNNITTYFENENILVYRIS